MLYVDIASSAVQLSCVLKVGFALNAACSAAYISIYIYKFIYLLIYLLMYVCTHMFAYVSVSLRLYLYYVQNYIVLVVCLDLSVSYNPSL